MKVDMEYDRLGGNNKLFFFGIICLVISIGLFFFSLYLIPYFLWEWGYDIPDFILNMLATYQDDYHYTSAGSKTVVWLIFFIPALITGLISYFVSRHLDNQMYGTGAPPAEEQEKASGEVQKQIKESAGLGGKILGLMILVVVLLFLLQYFVQSTT